MGKRKPNEQALKDDDMSIYNAEHLELELEEDEIESWEEAFMQGWAEA